MSTEKVNFYVEGMHCSSCQNKIEGAFRENFQLGCSVDLKENKVTAEVGDNSPIELKKCLDQLGFRVVKISKDND